MRQSYDAIVIGTGFGGAVAACRLAHAGLAVGIIERGRRYPMNSFPRDFDNPLNGWLWSVGQGLFDVRPLNQMMIVQGAGYGGGSLIYANVHLRAPADVFESGWPAGYSRAALDPYYDLAAWMLDIKPITESRHLGIPPKTAAMRTAARKLGRQGQFVYPTIAVDFGEPEQIHPNRFGTDQKGCSYCGECDIGCNLHAKNTLDLNYLALAERHGAETRLQCEATRIAPSSTGYNISFIDHAAGGSEDNIQAKFVFLCGGAINSTELLLRCRDQHRTLPNLSRRLGDNYSANGDFLAFAFDATEKLEPWRGPTITTGVVYDRGAGAERNWFIFEEGGYPKQIAGMLQILNPNGGAFGAIATMTQSELIAAFRGAAGRGASATAGGADSAVFLAMGRDRANGKITLAPLVNSLFVEWNVASNLPLYDVEAGLGGDIAAALGGKFALNPFWERLRQPVSVHNLGGCVMADSAERGVVNGDGEAFGYPNLFVLDGAILPGATGVNPSHTIAAVAERNIEIAIRKITGNSSWRAPETASAAPVIDPLAQVTIPAGGTMEPKTRIIGLSFTETMKGFIDKGHNPADDFLGAEKAGQAANTLVDFTLTINFPNLDAAIADPRHPGVASGVIHAAGFTGPAGAPVNNGVFNLFVDSNAPNERRMLYALPFIGADGRPYLLDGFKDVRDHGHFDVWGATSTLYTSIRDGHERTGAVAASGVMHILMPDFMRQLTTFTVSGTNDPAAKAAAITRFGRLFMGTLWDVFVRPRLP